MVWFSQIASDTLLPEQEFLAKLPLLFFACSKFCSSAPPPGGFFEGLSRAPLSLGPTHQHQGIPTPISHTDTPKCPQTFHKAFSKGASPIPTSRSKGGSSLLHIWLILILRYFMIIWICFLKPEKSQCLSISHYSLTWGLKPVFPKQNFSMLTYPQSVGNMVTETTFDHWKVVFSGP